MTHDVVVADPPWSYTGQQDKWGAAAKFYATMSNEELLDFNMGQFLKNYGVLFLWATGPRLDFAVKCIEAWGLTYRGVAFVWVKTKKTDPQTPIGAQGVRPSIVKPTTEFVLAASRVATGRPMRLWDESIRQVVLAPKQEHSRKPDAVLERIESMYPEASKIELFARREREGWDSWGDQIGTTSEPA